MSAKETLEVPAAMRAAAARRDRGCCRMCGKRLGERACLHHIFYGGDQVGMGGRRRHRLGGLVSLCWLPGDNGCHQRAHADKARWQPLLAQVVRIDGMTALALARQLRRRRFSAARGRG